MQNREALFLSTDNLCPNLEAMSLVAVPYNNLGGKRPPTCPTALAEPPKGATPQRGCGGTPNHFCRQGLWRQVPRLTVVLIGMLPPVFVGEVQR